MKYLLSLMLTTILLSNSVCAQTTTSTNSKDVLKTIWLAYQCWTTGSNTDYSEPNTYINDDKSKEVIGQNFLFPVSNQKFVVIRLDNLNSPIISATYLEQENTRKVLLKWEANKLVGIKIDALLNFDYTVDYENNNIIGFTSNGLIGGGSIQVKSRIEYTNELISKITKYENKVNAKQPWIRSIKTISYNESETTVNCFTYASNKPNIPQNIISTMQGIYKKEVNGVYTVIQPYGDKTDISYNKNNEIVKKIITKNNEIESHEYFYINDKLFKEETVIKNGNGELMGKEIYVLFSLPVQNANVEDWDKKMGTYKFNSSGDLIFEKNGMKFRTKENGIWSDWQNVRY